MGWSEEHLHEHLVKSIIECFENKFWIEAKLWKVDYLKW